MHIEKKWWRGEGDGGGILERIWSDFWQNSSADARQMRCLLLQFRSMFKMNNPVPSLLDKRVENDATFCKITDRKLLPPHSPTNPHCANNLLVSRGLPVIFGIFAEYLRKWPCLPCSYSVPVLPNIAGYPRGTDIFWHSAAHRATGHTNKLLYFSSKTTSIHWS
jgi:hypothetical protein